MTKKKDVYKVTRVIFRLAASEYSGVFSVTNLDVEIEKTNQTQLYPLEGY